MNELIKTLQVWVDNPMSDTRCNIPNVVTCKGILCRECPMKIDKKPSHIVSTKLAKFNERTNKNIKPNNN